MQNSKMRIDANESQTQFLHLPNGKDFFMLISSHGRPRSPRTMRRSPAVRFLLFLLLGSGLNAWAVTAEDLSRSAPFSLSAPDLAAAAAALPTPPPDAEVRILLDAG